MGEDGLNGLLQRGNNDRIRCASVNRGIQHEKSEDETNKNQKNTREREIRLTVDE